MEINDKQIIISITVPAPIDSVWQGWSTSAGMAAFMDVEANIELWRGGKFELLFGEGETGKRGSEGCTVISFVPREMISFSWNAPPEQAYVRNHDYKTWVTIFFKTVPEGTEVRLVHTGWPVGNEWDFTRAYFEKAWPYVLNAQKVYWENKAGK